MKKIIKLFLIIVLSIVAIGLTSFHLIAPTKWEDHFSSEEMETFARTINETPELPENFYSTFDKYYPGLRTKTITKFSYLVAWHILTLQKDELKTGTVCNCMKVSNWLHKQTSDRKFITYGLYKIGWGVEKYSSEEKSLDFILNKWNIYEQSLVFFNKELSSLNEEENLELIVRLNNPTLSNERIAGRIGIIKMRLK